MLSLKLGLILCVYFIIGMEAAPKPNPEDLHIHLNLHDPTSAAGVAQAAGDYGKILDQDNGNGRDGENSGRHPSS